MEHALHLGLGLRGDDPRTRDVLAPLGRVRNRIVHVGDAALVDQVDNQLHFVQALEIGHLGGIAGFHQRLEAAADEFDEAAAQHHLLTEQISLALLAEIGLDHTRTTATHARCIGQRDVMGIARGVLVHGDQARHTAALDELAPHRMARALGRNHDHVDSRFRLDQVEMHVETMRESDRGAITDVGLDVLLVGIGLQFVRDQHHEHVGPLGGIGDAHHLEPGAFGLLGRGRTRTQRDDDFGDAAVAQVLRMRMALAAIADDGNFAGLDDVEIGIPIIENAHGLLPCKRSGHPADLKCQLFFGASGTP